jgi:ATP-dependent helicase HepA
MGFVKVGNGALSARGVAKVVQSRNSQRLLEYFDVPGQACSTCWVDKSKVERLKLPVQTRVFVNSLNGRTWRVGRVLDGEGDTILVQLPNSMPANIEIARVFVRWSEPIVDPTSFLAQKITETPLFADARGAFLARVTGQRIASLGMGALLSSQIDLSEYQFDVVRRVLQDPIQRYLLADEVGLGKTIEAGILIRQYFIDEPAGARALVIAPRALVDQWRQELRDRFALGPDMDADMLLVVAADDVACIEEVIGEAGMLVVDEAHHLSRAQEADEVLYELLRAHAPRVPRLLLLSATPALVDEAGFLRMVHLLDPVTFPLDDFEGFRQRIASRQDIVETVAALTPGNVFILERYLDRLANAFPDDDLLAKYLGELRQIVERYPDEADEDFVLALGNLRNHLSETYRLHRRIVRNRRSTVPPWITPQRAGLQRWHYNCHATANYAVAAESFRLAVANSHAALDPFLLQRVLRASLDPLDEAEWNGMALQVERQDADLLPPLAALRQARTQLLDEGVRLDRLCDGIDALLGERCQIVVFCGSGEVADQVYERLAYDLHCKVARHSPECDDGEDDVPEWRRFLTDPQCRILVCDRHAEEGLNLHGGRKVVVNFDLPASPNIIEQRLGRVDRFGAREDISTFALVCDDHPLEQAWLDCLDTGFGVFSQSIASLQYMVDEMLKGLPQGWLSQGAAFITDLASGLRGPEGRVQRELRRIDQQDALDALSSDPGDESFARLEEIDEEWQSFGAQVEAFLFQALQFQKRNVPCASCVVEHDQVFRVTYAYDRSRETLITVPEFVGYFLAEMDDEAQGGARSPTSFAYTFRRPTVLTREARRQRVRLLRYGSGLIDSLTRFIERDDRGRVFAMWRYRPAATLADQAGSELYFRFDFVVEADIGGGDVDAGGAAPRALRRVADGIMEPSFVRIWLDDQLRQVAEPKAELLEPYRNKPGDDGGRDFNLNPDRWEQMKLQELFIDEHWASLCGKARAVAEENLRQMSSYREHVATALGRMCDLHQLKQGQMEARIARLRGAARAAEQQEFARQQALDMRLEDAVRAPVVRLDAIGAMFLSKTNPFGSAA